MKKNFLIFFLLIGINSVHGQSCEELLSYVKSKGGYGTTYTSYNSDAITKVTFYDIMIDYKTYYFAIVCFKDQYSFNCKEYSYQVGSNTKWNYSINYLESARRAFWKYIHPHNQNLQCAPKFEDD